MISFNAGLSLVSPSPVAPCSWTLITERANERPDAAALAVVSASTVQAAAAAAAAANSRRRESRSVQPASPSTAMIDSCLSWPGIFILERPRVLGRLLSRAAKGLVDCDGEVALEHSAPEVGFGRFDRDPQLSPSVRGVALDGVGPAANAVRPVGGCNAGPALVEILADLMSDLIELEVPRRVQRLVHVCLRAPGESWERQVPRRRPLLLQILGAVDPVNRRVGERRHPPGQAPGGPESAPIVDFEWSAVRVEGIGDRVQR